MNETTLIAWAKELGFGRAALCSADGFTQSKRTVDEQPVIPERKQLRFFPKEDYPETKSLAVLLWPYTPALPGAGKAIFVDSYYEASNRAYYAARELERRLNEAGCFARANTAYPAREAALRAGLGVIGRSSMLITPEYGTRVVIILMATDIEIKPTKQNKCAECLQCGRCTSVCPSGAIDENGMTHPERCLRNYMMEGVVVPEDIREKMGMTLIGCDLCQRVCPMQPHVQNTDGLPVFSLDEFLTEDVQAFRQAIDRLGQVIGRNISRPQRVRAQAALLAGNLADPAYLSVLQTWSCAEFQAVREHARWAISRICEVRKSESGT